MATKTEKNPKTGTSRAEKIERYILIEALTMFLVNLRHPKTGVDFFKGVLPDGRVYGEDLDYEEMTYRLGYFDGGSLFTELWPEDEDTDSDEFGLVSARVDLLVMEMFSALARNTEALLDTSFYFGKLAGKELSKLRPVWDMPEESFTA